MVPQTYAYPCNFLNGCSNGTAAIPSALLSHAQMVVVRAQLFFSKLHTMNETRRPMSKVRGLT